MTRDLDSYNSLPEQDQLNIQTFMSDVWQAHWREHLELPKRDWDATLALLGGQVSRHLFTHMSKSSGVAEMGLTAQWRLPAVEEHDDTGVYQVRPIYSATTRWPAGMDGDDDVLKANCTTDHVWSKPFDRYGAAASAVQRRGLRGKRTEYVLRGSEIRRHLEQQILAQPDRLSVGLLYEPEPRGAKLSSVKWIYASVFEVPPSLRSPHWYATTYQLHGVEGVRAQARRMIAVEHDRAVRERRALDPDVCKFMGRVLRMAQRSVAESREVIDNER